MKAEVVITHWKVDFQYPFPEWVICGCISVTAWKHQGRESCRHSNQWNELEFDGSLPGKAAVCLLGLEGGLSKQRTKWWKQWKDMDQAVTFRRASVHSGRADENASYFLSIGKVQKIKRPFRVTLGIFWMTVGSWAWNDVEGNDSTRLDSVVNVSLRYGNSVLLVFSF